MEPIPVAVYRRTVRASLARIWENVLDWEHLPWLHRETFAHVHLLSHHRDGWRARTAMRAPEGSPDLELEVELERSRLCYHSRTVAGPGADSDIFTRLEPVDADATRIVVEFRVPGVAPEHATAVGGWYTRLYERLWDQDEAMMTRRQAVLDAPLSPVFSPTPQPLGSLEAVRTRLPLVVDFDGRSFRLVEVDGAIVAHPTVCPHQGGPLTDVAVQDGCVICPWHGYRFDVRTGMSADGRGLRLDAAPRVVVAADSQCTLGWDAFAATAR